MTTNAGAADLRRAQIGFTSQRRHGDEMAGKRLFTPEFRNRPGCHVQFGRSTTDHPARGRQVPHRSWRAAAREKGRGLDSARARRKWLADQRL